MLAIIFKGLIFYFLFVFIRNVIFGFKSYQQVKEGIGANPNQNPGKTRKYSGHGEDVVEAEYRVIKD